MEPAQYDGKLFALLLCGETETGEPDWAIFSGIARFRDGNLFMDRAEGKPPFEIRSEWLDRIKPVASPEVRSILNGAEYVLQLLVGSKPDHDDDGEFIPTGLKWPD